MSSEFENHVCLITGCGQGIGRAVAEGLVARGATVIATSLREPEIAGADWTLKWDVTHAHSAETIVQRVLERYRRIDSFIANAGHDPVEEWDSISPERWREVLATNLDGVWFGAQAVGKAMSRQGYGKIVMVGSILSETGGLGQRPHYVTAKAGLIGLTRSLSRALGPNGVRVNLVMPGAIKTARELEQFPDQSAVEANLATLQCIRTRLTPADIVPTFAFLCSTDSDAITGQVICVDNGWVHY